MKVVCLGGGPAGLYFSILAKKANPSGISLWSNAIAHDSTFGWGVVFSDKTMDGFRAADPETHAGITEAFRHWDDIDVFFKGRKILQAGTVSAALAGSGCCKFFSSERRTRCAACASTTRSPDPDDYAADYSIL